ncbi:hypothetical protein BDN72DRAFT_962863 [Pluteus cervinus]|uniref:Uncharacterized protein n=1 Tax=Pluteus cervinus TaxID=181527 RepID=A0ACD3AHS3_9AGAR|nr:hypothetical protein BDN72DRAFT_962863 [Pluteus cervinus]
MLDIPTLPNELEQEILQLAARISPETALRLLAVSKKVKIWIQPIVYEVVVIQDHDLKPSYYPECVGPHSNLNQIFKENGGHIRSLLLHHPSESSLLAYCPTITSLSMDQPLTLELLAAIQKIPLHHLRCNLTGCKSAVDPDSLAFSNITHLDLLNPPRWRHCQFLAQMPKLTHLALDDPEGSSRLEETVKSALEHCRYLEALLLVLDLVTGQIQDDIEVREDYLPVQDNRIVAISVHPLVGWLNGELGKGDMWKVAEGVIANRIKEHSTAHSENSNSSS